MITKVNEEIEGEFKNEEISDDSPKIQWVQQKNYQLIKILIPKPLFINEEFNEHSLEEIEACVEKYYLELKDGQEIQFVRYGYCRKDSNGLAIFSHK